MSWTLCTSGSAISKAGANANSTITASGVALSNWSTEAEGRIEAETRRSWVTNHSGLPTGIKGALSDLSSAIIATNIIGYDATGYLQREQDNLLNINDEIITKNMKVLKDFKSNNLLAP